jgi:two-component system nitrate/nitrite response regulator NarL
VTAQSSRAETTVVVIDDPTLFAESLRTALDLEGYDVRWVAAEPAIVRQAHGVSAVEGRPPRIAVLDIDLDSERDPLDLLKQLSSDGIRVVVVTVSDDLDRWAECLECGAASVLPKTLPLSDVLSVVRRLHDGLPVMTEAARTELVQEWHHRTSVHDELGTRFARLDGVERWVLGRLMEGATVQDIVDRWPMAPGAVRAHLRSILDKLDAVTWLDAVSLANEFGWSPVDWGD